MKKSAKILLSIPSLLSLVLFVLIVFPSLSFKVFPTIETYNFIAFLVFAITIIQLVFLIKYLWNIKSIDKKVKSDWTALLLIFPQITSLIFIWKKADDFRNQKEE